MPTPPNYQGLYNNGGYYGLGATVLTDGNPYGINGYYYIRSGNPGNPGYPPSSDGIPNGSWTLYTFPKMVSGSGSITGSGNIMGEPITNGPTYAYSYTIPNINQVIFDLNGGIATFNFYQNPSELFTLANGTVVTISGVTGPYAALNGTSFIVETADPSPGYAYYDSLTGGTFRSTWVSLNIPLYGTTIDFNIGGNFTWNWN
jgi:hypothetical protein